LSKANFEKRKLLKHQKNLFMRNLKKIERNQLKEIKGGEVIIDDPNCGTWCKGIWHPCTINHLACPPD